LLEPPRTRDVETQSNALWLLTAEVQTEPSPTNAVSEIFLKLLTVPIEAWILNGVSVGRWRFVTVKALHGDRCLFHHAS
jgi:hypothetical protein